MKTAHRLKVAAGLALLQGCVHALLFLTAKPKHGAEEAAVVEAMRSHAFNFAGSVRSYWELYVGYGLLAAGSCFIEAAVLWQLARIARVDPVAARPIIWVFLAANAGHALVALRYFFVTPIIPDAAVALCLGMALVAARRVPSLAPAAR